MIEADLAVTGIGELAFVTDNERSIEEQSLPFPLETVRVGIGTDRYVLAAGGRSVRQAGVAPGQFLNQGDRFRMGHCALVRAVIRWPLSLAIA